MRIVVLAVGRIRPPYADDVQHYRKLLAGQARVEIQECRDEERVAKRIPERAFVSQLDAGGEQLSSEAFATWMERRRQEGRDVWFLIGGPHGLDLEGRHVDHKLSFGPMTLPHQLARVVLLEQVYRAHKILAREPYHY
ncbi:MAG: 23S rRNA (pseudouridine(1915)-N(3))-methyltransferase RlmH [Solirubrobacterales bacterium]|nr:23S rRNA (pseudouridine(1915)-N(3))-methyltransferase RlmH [Solirubrobacterales bacterium]